MSTRLGIGLPLASHRAIGTTYYIHAGSGNDANAGTSTTAPLQSITAVNALALQPGDNVVFARGQTWTGTQLVVAASGSQGRPISFGAYGNGAKPILSGGGITEAMQADGVGFLHFDSLDFRAGLNFGAGFSNGCHDITFLNCDASGCGNDNVIFLGSCYNIVVDNLTSSGATNTAGAGSISSCLEIANGSYDVVVRNSTFSGSADVGMTIHGHSGAEVPHNVTVSNCVSHDNTNAGFQVLGNSGTGTADQAIVFENCRSYNNAGATAGRGLYISNSGGAYYPAGIDVSDCAFYANGVEAAYIVGDSVTLTRCWFANGKGLLITNGIGVTLRHCTIYNSTGSIAAFRVSGTRTANIVGRNNIIFENIAGFVIVDVTVAGGGFDWDYCLYKRIGGTAANAHWAWNGTGLTFANWQSTAGADAHSPTPADPLFTDQAANDFTLQAGSPAIDKGVVIAGVNDGTAGSTAYLGAAPDLGYAERS